VPLRILFADDSMTAQNMGKKILSEAGYDVVAVSNGAAAVKKIAEQKPDIIILDVYMPGYSGLEVCEKVRASIDTAKTPVLLTVGKMEPYKPEDANRVKADGVIIKPFEASDLLAIVKKFEERIALMPPPPIAVQPVRVERKYEEEQPEPIEHRSSSGKSSMQPMVEVPDHMAGTSAFSDLLGPDAPNTTQHFAVNTPAAAFETSVIVPAPPMPAAEDEPPVSWKEEVQEEAGPISAEAVEPEQEIIATPVVTAPEPVEEAPLEATIAVPDTQAIPVEASEPEPPHPQFIPVFKEPEPEPAAYEMVPTAAPPTGEIEIPREPELQETAEETTRNTVADKVEPGLLSPIEQQMETQAVAQPEPSVVDIPSADASPAEAAVMEVTPAESYSAPQPTIEPEPPAVASLPIEQPLTETQIETPPVEANAIGDSDFEARVAAAMAAYNHAEAVPAPAAAIESAVTESPVTVAVEAASANIHAPEAFEVAHANSEPAPSFEYHPSAQTFAPAPVAHIAPAPTEFVAEPAPVPQISAPPAFVPAKLESTEPEIVHNALTNGVEVAAVAGTGADHHNIAQAIHRVMERLKPELVDEIMRELNSKK
jgi:CheY-like chemotaxis protein